MRSPGPEGRKVQIQSRWSPRCRAGLPVSRPRCGTSQAWSSHSDGHPGRKVGDGLRALSPRAKARRCAGFGRLCLHRQTSFEGTSSLQRTFLCVQPKYAAEVARLRTIIKAELAVSSQLLNRTSIKKLAVGLHSPGTGTPFSGRQSPNDLERKYAARMICGRSQRARFGPKRKWTARMDGAGHPAPRGPQWWKPHCIGRRVKGGAVAAT